MRPSTEREGETEWKLLQGAEGLPCAKQVACSLCPREAKLDPAVAAPGQRVRHSDNLPELCPDPPVLTPGCQPHFPGGLRLQTRRDLGVCFPPPPSQGRTGRPRRPSRDRAVHGWQSGRTATPEPQPLPWSWQAAPLPPCPLHPRDPLLTLTHPPRGQSCPRQLTQSGVRLPAPP